MSNLTVKNLTRVIPAQAGIHCKKWLKFKMDSRLRGNDERKKTRFKFYE
jgi:hypothetical protein